MLLLFTEYDKIINVKGNAVILQTMKLWLHVNKIENLKDDEIREGVAVKFNQAQSTLEDMVKKGKFILAYYDDKRAFQAEKPEHIEKVKLQDKYKITEAPGKLFIKYLF